MWIVEIVCKRSTWSFGTKLTKTLNFTFNCCRKKIKKEKDKGEGRGENNNKKHPKQKLPCCNSKLISQPVEILPLISH